MPRSLQSWIKKANPVTTKTTDSSTLPELKVWLKDISTLDSYIQTTLKSGLLQAMATREYYHGVLLDRLESYNNDDSLVRSEVEKMQQELSTLNEGMHRHQLHHLGKCQAVMETSSHCLQYSASHLFLLLPEDLELWDDMDPGTHAFRLYFLCDSRSSLITNIQPQHIHISKHQGYALHRQQEFLQLYGQYALTLLEMVKQGFSQNAYNVPSIDSAEILSLCHQASAHHSLTQDNIVTLVDKAIAYIRKVPLDGLPWKPVLDPHETRHIRSFLCVETGDNALGGLCRTVYKSPGTPTRWLCDAHSQEYASTRKLKKFVDTHGGTIDWQSGIVCIQLDSPSQAAGFIQELQIASNFTADVAIRLAWYATRSEIRGILLSTAKTGTVVLQLDGPTVNDQSQSFFQRNDDIYAAVINTGSLQAVSLRDYPRPSEICVYLGSTGDIVFNVHFVNLELSQCDLLDLQRTLDRGMRLITGPTWPPRPIDSILNAVLIKLTSSLASGIAGIDIYDQANNTWHGRMRVNEGIISGLTEVSIPSKFFQDPILSHGTLQRLKVRKHDLAIKNHTHALIKLNLGLQYLEFPAQEDQALWHLGFILKTRNKSAGQLRVILLEESNNTEICIANVEIGVQGANDEGKPVVIDVLEWTCSHIAGGAGDTDAAILDMITLRFPPTLTSLAFDISDLTDQGLTSFQNILLQSALSHLSINCTFGPTLESKVCRVMKVVQWSAVSSFMLITDDADQWVRLWDKDGNLFACIEASRLQVLRIVGTGETPLPLSHSSVLHLHSLIYSNTLVELHLERIPLKDQRDWGLLMDAIDFSCLEYLSIVNSSIEDKTVIADRLKGHLPGSDLALSTSPSAMSYLTIASSQRQYRGTAESNAEQNNVFHTLAINGLDVLAELCPDYQTCLVESSSATNTRGQKIMESGALYPAMVRADLVGSMEQSYCIYPITQYTPGLLEVEVPFQVEAIHHAIGRLRKAWNHEANHLQVTLVPKQGPPGTFVILNSQEAQTNKDADKSFRGSCFTRNGDTLGVCVVQWKVGDVSDPLHDEEAILLDLASVQHPSVLSKFRLDISSLSSRGWASIQSILGRSTLEHLHIICNSIQERDREVISRILIAIHHGSIKSLVFEGDAINEWMDAWKTDDRFPDFALQRLKLIGPPRSGQSIPTSVCHFLAQMIRADKLQELHIENFNKRYFYIRKAEEELTAAIRISGLRACHVPDWLEKEIRDGGPTAEPSPGSSPSPSIRQIPTNESKGRFEHVKTSIAIS